LSGNKPVPVFDIGTVTLRWDGVGFRTRFTTNCTGNGLLYPGLAIGAVVVVSCLSSGLLSYEDIVDSGELRSRYTGGRWSESVFLGVSLQNKTYEIAVGKASV
jgi:hypothetical protein